MSLQELPRREQILEAAIALFRARGYERTGMIDIGAAVGVSGAAVYRHYPSKSDLLGSAVEQASMSMQAGLESVERLPPVEAMRELVRSYVVTVFDNRDAIALYRTEQHSLSDELRRRLHADVAHQTEVWTSTLCAVRNELMAYEARALVRGALQLVNALAYHEPELPLPRLLELVEAATLRALSVVE